MTSTSIARYLALLVVPLSGQLAIAEHNPPTAQQVVLEIQKNIGIPWNSDTVDTFKAGNPDTPVTGIAVTMMATLDVLQRAAAKRENLIITHEPTFFDHFDDPKGLDQNDLVWKAKRKFIEEHGLVIWRFHDHWHMRKPDGILSGVVRALKWERYQSVSDPRLFTIPEMSVAKLAEYAANHLDSPIVRVVGNGESKATRVALSPGAAGFVTETRALASNDVQVLLVGETPEWETVEYAADAISAGYQKALIIIGHVASEQPGMQDCAHWLATFVKDVPVEFVPTFQLFWTPSKHERE